MIYIFDLNKLAREIYSYLKIYYFDKQVLESINENVFIKDLETSLVLEINIFIENNINYLIRVTNKTLFPYEKIIQNYNLNKTDFLFTISELNSYKNIFNQLEDIIHPNGFDIWLLTKKYNFYTLENLGDYRIIEWYQDHVRNNKYCKNR